MGWFTNVAAAILEEHGETFTQNTRIYRFGEDIYVSWCQPLIEIQSEGWLSIAENTLHVQTEYPIHSVNTTIPPVVQKVSQNAHRYNDLIRLGEIGGLFHMVLPPYFVLRLGMAQPFPIYALPHGSRLAVGWICQPVSRFNFTFEEISQEDFIVQAHIIKRSVEEGQAEAIEMEKELDNIEQLLRIQQGNRRYLEVQAAQRGMDVPLPLYNELKYVQEQINLLHNRKEQLLYRW